MSIVMNASANTKKLFQRKTLSSFFIFAFVMMSACTPKIRSAARTPAAVAPTNPSTISATGPTTVGSASVVTITLLDDDSVPITGVVPTFTSSNAADTEGVCNASDGAGVSTCTLDSTVAELKTLTIATPLAAAGKTGTTIFTADVAASLTATGFTDPIVAGVAQNITITAYDVHGNVATGYVGEVEITSNDGAATLPADYTFVAGDAGVRAISVTLRTAGANRTITATDTGNGALTATQSGIDVTAAAAAKLSFSSQQPVGGVDTDTNLATQPIVQVLDAYDNVVTTATDSVTLEASSSATCASVIASGVSATSNPLAAIAGSASFSAVKVLNTSATRLKATSGSLTAACSNAFVVTPGTFNTTTSTFTLNASTVGTGLTLTASVTPKDANGNNTTVGFTGEAQITFAYAGGTSTATFAATAAPVSGVYTSTVTGGTIGTATTITATINGSDLVTTRTLTVTGAAFGALDHFLVSMNAAPAAHTSETITITAQDASNNTVTTDTSTVVFTSTDDDVTLPANLTLAAGTGSTSITLRSVGSVTVTVTSGAITGSQTVTVQSCIGVCPTTKHTEYTTGRFVDHDSRFGGKWWNGWFLFSGGKDDGRKLIAYDGSNTQDVSSLMQENGRFDVDPGPINFINGDYALYSAFDFSDGKYYMYWADWANNTNIPVTHEVAANEVSYRFIRNSLAFKGLDTDGYRKLICIGHASTTADLTLNTSSCNTTSAAGGTGVVDPAPCGGGGALSTRHEEPLNITEYVAGGFDKNGYFTSLNYYGDRRLYYYNANMDTLTDISPIAGSITVAQTQVDSTGRLFYITSDGTSPELYVYTPGVGNLKLTHGWDAVPSIGTFAYNVDKFSYLEAADFVFYIADRSAGAVGTNKLFRVLSDGTSTAEVSNILAGDEGGIDVLVNGLGNIDSIANGGTGVALYHDGNNKDTTQYFTTASLYAYSGTLRVLSGIINGIASLWSYDPSTNSALTEVPLGFGSAEGYTSITPYPDPSMPTTISARAYKPVNDTTQAVMRSGSLAGNKRVINTGGTKGRDKPLYPTYFNGYIYYAGLDATGAYKLFKTDGTTITQISDTRGAGRSDGITAVVATSTGLWFTALASATALKLYRARANDGVTQVSDIMPGSSDQIANLVAGTSRVYFTATAAQRVYYITDDVSSATMASATTNCSLLTIGSSDSVYFRGGDELLHGYKTDGTTSTSPAPSGFIVGKGANTAWSGSYLYFSNLVGLMSRHNVDMGNTFDEVYKVPNVLTGLTYYRGHLYLFERIVSGPPSQYRIVDIYLNNTEANLADDITTTNSIIAFNDPSEAVPVFNGTQTFVYFTAQEADLSWTLFRWDPVGLALTRTAAASHTARPTLLTRVGSSLVFVNNHTADATVTGKISILDNTGTITDAAASLSQYHTDDITWIKNVNGTTYFNGNAAGTIDYTRLYQFQE
jgi:hypothetical protein